MMEIPPPEPIRNDEPRRVENAFLVDSRYRGKLKNLLKGRGPNAPVEAIKEPFLVLMKNDGYSDIIENVQPGAFIINTPNGKQKQINLQPHKLS